MAAERHLKSSSKKKNSAIPKKKIAELIAEADPQPLGRVLYLTGEVSEESIATTISEIVSCVNQNKIDPITLIINTSGGSVDDMFALYDIMKFIPCPIHTVGLGKVMSAGVLLLASGHKGNRMLGKHARVMIHPMSDELTGDVFQIANELKESQKSQKMMEEALMTETKITPRQIEVFMRAGHDSFLTPEDALKMGIVDKIIG